MNESSCLEDLENKKIVEAHMSLTASAVRDMISHRTEFFADLCDRLLPDDGDRAFQPRSEVEAQLVSELAGFHLMRALHEYANELEEQGAK